MSTACNIHQFQLKLKIKLNSELELEAESASIAAAVHVKTAADSTAATCALILQLEQQKQQQQQQQPQRQQRQLQRQPRNQLTTHQACLALCQPRPSFQNSKHPFVAEKWKYKKKIATLLSRQTGTTPGYTEPETEPEPETYWGCQLALMFGFISPKRQIKQFVAVFCCRFLLCFPSMRHSGLKCLQIEVKFGKFK